LGLAERRKHHREFWEIDFDLLKVIMFSLCHGKSPLKEHQLREYMSTCCSKKKYGKQIQVEVLFWATILQ